MTADKKSGLKVTLFLPDLEMGGAERVFVTLSKGFIRRGVQVRLILAQKRGPLLEELDPAVEINDLSANPPGSPRWLFVVRTILRLATCLRRQPPQVLMSTLTGANMVAIIATFLSATRTPVVLREAAPLRNVQSILWRFLMRYVYRGADRIVVLTKNMQHQIQDSLNLPIEKLCIIPNPLDKERIQGLSLECSEEPVIKALQPYVLSVGRLVYPKGYSTLVRASAHLDSPLNIVVIGEGALREELEAEIAALGLVGRVHLVGFRSNPYSWFRQASGFALSSIWEGYPNALVEAIYFGIPVVVTEYDASVREVIAGLNWTENCIFVPPGDEVAMAAGLDQLPVRKTGLTYTTYSQGVPDPINMYLDLLVKSANLASSSKGVDVKS